MLDTIRVKFPISPDYDQLQFWTRKTTRKETNGEREYFLYNPKVTDDKVMLKVLIGAGEYQPFMLSDEIHHRFDFLHTWAGVDGLKLETCGQNLGGVGRPSRKSTGTMCGDLRRVRCASQMTGVRRPPERTPGRCVGTFDGDVKRTSPPSSLPKKGAPRGCFAKGNLMEMKAGRGG